MPKPKSYYAAKYKHPNWQKKRLEILSRDNFKCLGCDDGNKTLNVHHRIYITGREPWDYHESLLATLCEDCHKDIHEGEDRCSNDWIGHGEVIFLNETEEVAWSPHQDVYKYAIQKLESIGITWEQVYEEFFATLKEPSNV